MDARLLSVRAHARHGERTVNKLGYVITRSHNKRTQHIVVRRRNDALCYTACGRRFLWGLVAQEVDEGAFPCKACEKCMPE